MHVEIGKLKPWKLVSGKKKPTRKTKGERLLSHSAKSASRLESCTLQRSSVTLLSVCLCHVQCVHSCTMGLLNQPTLLNIDGLFTQECCAAGSSWAACPPPWSLPCQANDAWWGKKAAEMQTGNVYAEPGWIGMELQVLKWLVVLKTPQPRPSLSFLRKHTSVRRLMAKPSRRICDTIYVRQARTNTVCRRDVASSSTHLSQLKGHRVQASAVNMCFYIWLKSPVL